MDDGIDMSLYKEEMLRLAGQTSAQGHLIAPQAQADKVSKLCGSKIHVELCLGQDKKQVSEFAYEIEACVLGQASAALLAEKIIGTSPDELRGLAKAMDKMLKDNVPIKKERWLGFSLFQSVHHYPMRHSSTYLAFEAVEDCLGQLGV